jgi:hypothetical protein
MSTSASPMSANGTVAGSIAGTGDTYAVRLWSGNKKASIAYPQQRVETSLRWAESDEGIAAWPTGAIGDKIPDEKVKVDHPHGSLRAVRVSMAPTTGEMGPALVIDSISVAAASNGARFVCTNPKGSSASIQPGASTDLNCRKE